MGISGSQEYLTDFEYLFWFCVSCLFILFVRNAEAILLLHTLSHVYWETADWHKQLHSSLVVNCQDSPHRSTFCFKQIPHGAHTGVSLREWRPMGMPPRWVIRMSSNLTTLSYASLFRSTSCWIQWDWFPSQCVDCTRNIALETLYVSLC